MVVGLGNPGEKYENTRHNLGYRVVKALRLSAFSGADLYTPQSPFGGDSPTYMNESGRPVGHIVRYKHLQPDEVLVVCDDFSIPLGTLRIRAGGSSGGHNGLDSVIQALGDQNIPRLRIGIGPVPDGQDPAEFVLENFVGRDVKGKVEIMIEAAAEAVRVAVNEGLETAMNRFNKSLP